MIKHNIRLLAGEEYALQLPITYKGKPVDLTNALIHSHIRQRRDSVEKITEFVADKSEAADGRIVLSLSEEQTKAIYEGVSRFYPRAVYDVRIVLDEVTTYVVEGVIEIKQAITRG